MLAGKGIEDEIGADMLDRHHRHVSVAWRSGSEEQLLLEYVLFESENQHKRALNRMLEAERRADITVMALRSAESKFSALCNAHEEEIRKCGRKYSENEVDMDLSLERAENKLLQAC